MYQFIISWRTKNYVYFLSQMQVSFVTESRKLDLAFQQSKQSKSIWIEKHFSLASEVFDKNISDQKLLQFFFLFEYIPSARTLETCPCKSLESIKDPSERIVTTPTDISSDPESIRPFWNRMLWMAPVWWAKMAVSLG